MVGKKTHLVPPYEIFDTLDLLNETIPVVVVVVVHPPLFRLCFRHGSYCVLVSLIPPVAPH